MLPKQLLSLALPISFGYGYPGYGHMPLVETRQSSGNESFGDPSVTAVDPFDHSWITRFTALGDSYSVGLGAGHYISAATGLELNADCYQYSYGYPNLLNSLDMIGNNPNRLFQYFGCSGALVGDIQTKQVPKMQNAQLVTLSAGGNDANLATILNYCIYQWATWLYPTCNQKLGWAKDTINSDQYTEGLQNLVNSITLKLDGSNARLYWVGYLRFWDVTTDGCDKVTWAFTRNYLYRQYLTQDHRTKMNDLVDSVNSKIKAVCEATDRCVFVDVQDDIDRISGHFCEPGVDESYHWKGGGVSQDREETFFYEWGTTKDDDDDNQKSIDQPRKRGLNPPIRPWMHSAEARDDAPPNAPNGTSPPDGTSFEAAIDYFVKAGVAAGEINGTIFEGDASQNVTTQGSLLPDRYGRVFHLDKFANGDVAVRILQAMDQEQAKMMNKPLEYTTVSACSTLTLATTSPTTTTGGAEPTCTGNQVEGSCTMGSLPSATPNSGPRGPICNKVDSDDNDYLMFNEEKAQQGVADYCASLISSNVVLSAEGSNPSPGIVSDAAENGGDVALVVMFDVDSCDPGTAPEDQELDFAAFGQDQCQLYLYTSLAQVCAKDSTWSDFNPDFPLEGGVWGGACALWAMTGQPAS